MDHVWDKLDTLDTAVHAYTYIRTCKHIAFSSFDAHKLCLDIRKQVCQRLAHVTLIHGGKTKRNEVNELS